MRSWKMVVGIRSQSFQSQAIQQQAGKKQVINITQIRFTCDSTIRMYLLLESSATASSIPSSICCQFSITKEGISHYSIITSFFVISHFFYALLLLEKIFLRMETDLSREKLCFYRGAKMLLRDLERLQTSTDLLVAFSTESMKIFLRLFVNRFCSLPESVSDLSSCYIFPSLCLYRDRQISSFCAVSTSLQLEKRSQLMDGKRGSTLMWLVRAQVQCCSVFKYLDLTICEDLLPLYFFEFDRTESSPLNSLRSVVLETSAILFVLDRFFFLSLLIKVIFLNELCFWGVGGRVKFCLGGVDVGMFWWNGGQENLMILGVRKMQLCSTLPMQYLGGWMAALINYFWLFSIDNKNKYYLSKFSANWKKETLNQRVKVALLMQGSSYIKAELYFCLDMVILECFCECRGFWGLMPLIDSGRDQSNQAQPIQQYIFLIIKG